ncbi:MAG TPA: hypothetical protein PKK92_03395, partial [Methanothrix sp.]|nr:hypothetical protein [Methanothrix sp.]
MDSRLFLLFQPIFTSASFEAGRFNIWFSHLPTLEDHDFTRLIIMPKEEDKLSALSPRDRQVLKE